ncbi:hypothetical protein [Klebsiella pneumoniae]|uniref:hypothetical protein n=1 Tax=Klebsiella pneumoniae TaxID=573 RepID=UPI001F5A89E4|nr:hypothetical protein [Klebsiella pneumoniae]
MFVKNGKYRAPLSGTIQRPLPVNSARYAPEAAWEELFLVLPRKSSLSSTAQRNLNAYNVLKQGTIAKADDYAVMSFTPESFTILIENPWRYHANKKAAHAH